MQSFCIGAVKGKDARFLQTAATDVSRKSVDCSQGELWSGRPAKANEVIGVAPVWGRPRRLRYFSFYAFWSSTWPSEVCWISGRVEGLWPFIWQVVTSLCMVLGDAVGASFPGFGEDTYA
uniref:Uncharacterized protein n=1 Tax=Fagus sylvatica TaxID=28930 RepID=A0A2N9FMR7_FAGSY